MTNETFYEMQLEGTHLNIILSSLSCYMQEQYRGIELGVVDVNEATEKIKVASDMQLVIKHLLGKTRHIPKQTAQNTGLVWCKEIDLDEQEEMVEPFEPFNDEGLQTDKVVESLSSVTKWIEGISDEDFMKNFPENSLQDVQKSDEQRQKELNDSVEYAKHCLDTFLKNQPKGNGDTLTKAWDNVKERHWDTIKQMGDK